MRLELDGQDPVETEVLRLDPSMALGEDAFGIPMLSAGGTIGALVVVGDDDTPGGDFARHIHFHGNSVSVVDEVATVDFDDRYIQLGTALDAATLQGHDGAFYLARANHTGTQPSTTISDWAEAVDDRVAVLLVAGANISLTYDDTITNTITVAFSGTLPVTSGGTGLNTVAANSLIYTSALDTFAVLMVGAAGTVLKGGNVAPSFSSIVDTDISATAAIAWSKVSKTGATLTDIPTRAITDLTGVLGVAHGGTGLATVSAGGIVYATTLNNVNALAIGAANTVLTSTGSVPQWSANFVYAALPTGNGSWDTGAGTTITVTRALTVSGTSTFSTGAVLGGNAATSLGLTINTAAANTRRITFQTAGVTRWFMGVEGTAESGSNAGSNFNITRRADDGSDLGAVWSINRATGLTVVSSGIALTGAFTLTGSATISGTLTIGAVSGSIGQITSAAGNTNGFIIWGRNGTTYAFALLNEAGNPVMRVPNSTTTVEFPGTSVLVTGGDLTVGSNGATARTFALNTAAANIRRIAYQTAGALRWSMDAGSAAESGANAGSNWILTAYNDAGTSLGAALTITRASLAAAFGGALTVTGLLTGSTATLTGLFTGTTATLSGLLTGTTATFSGQVTSTVATGTAPLIIASTTMVANLNAGLLGGQAGAYYLDLANATGTLALVRFPSTAGNWASPGLSFADSGYTQQNLGGSVRAITIVNNGSSPGVVQLHFNSDAIADATDISGLQWWIGATTPFKAAAVVAVVSGTAENAAGVGFKTSVGGVLTERWRISKDGHLFAIADGTYDIGASGATRPRNGYFSGDMDVAGTVTGAFATIGDLTVTGSFEAGGGLFSGDVIFNTAINVQGQGYWGVGAPSASAIVQIDSTTQAFLPPRMTTAQRNAIASQVDGLMIYNTTTGKHEGRSGGAWVAFY